MSVMGDKAPNPHPWQYAMYGAYPNPYQQFQAYQPHFYNNYYHEAMQFGHMNGGQPLNNMMQGPLKQFTPGGQLQPFNNQLEKDEKKEPMDEGNQELPPLPPGPPPPPQPSPPGSSPFYQQSNPGMPGPSGGPVRFNMARPQRPQFNNQPFNNSGSSKKKRKKNKNKFNQNNQNQMQNHNQHQGPQNFAPPLPNSQMIRPPAPPLPPGPPPPAPQPPPEEVKPLQMDPRPQPNILPANALEIRTVQEWPKELCNYISRCYIRCQNDVDKQRVTIILKGKIMRATNDDTLWIKDWASEPLPLLESEMDTVSVQPIFKAEGGPVQGKKRLSLANRLGARVRSRSRSRSNSQSRSPHKTRQRSPPSARGRRRRDRSGSSGSENDWTPPPSNKKNKGRNSEHFVKREVKGKNKGKGRGHFYMEFGENDVPVNSELLEKRAARFSAGGTNKRNNKMKQLTTTFTVTNTNHSLMVFEDSTGDFDLEDCHVVGVCQDIEKPYLRLTAAPEAAAVRPPDVLKQSLSRVKERWIKDQDYHYACEQLKSIRQDLTVQGIRDRLTVSVYETHARIALEKGDHAEFNQCQSQLKLLYDELPTDNTSEFTAYRILYFIFTKEYMDLNTEMTSLSEADCRDECISHALNVRSAWALCNYHKLFRLYRVAPRMSSYLMEWFLPRERKLALRTAIKAYRQTLPVSWLTQELAFGSDSECLEFLSQFSVVYADDERTKIDCKTSAAAIGSV